MKHKKLPSLLALSISLELVLSPMPALAETKSQNVMNTMGGALNLGMQAYNTFRGAPQGQPSPHISQDMANFAKQQTPAPDKHFTLQNMQKIPGLMEYIAKKNQDAAKSGGKAINPMSLNCTTLPTTLAEPNNEVCRNREVNGLAGDPKVQSDEAFAYYNQFVNIEKTYQNYSVRSNVGGQSFGTGCMQDAMAVLQGFFAYRLEQMDTMVTEFEAANAKFEAQSEMDLKAIREDSAVLNGESSKFATEFKNSDLFDYGKRFEDPACNSLLSKDDMDKFGKESGGLMGIEKKLKADLGTVPEGSKYSPETYLKNHTDVVKDINQMADKVAEQASLNFGDFANDKKAYSEFLGSVGGRVSTDSGANAALNSGFFSDLQTKFAKTSNKLSDEASLLGSELGGGSKAALSQLGNIDNDANFDAEVVSLENGIKGECVNRSGIDGALARIYDPTLSKSANKHSAAQIQKRIKAIIADVTISPEKKLAELQLIEAGGGDKYQMRMDADYETQEVKADGTITKKKVNAAGKVTPGNFFTDVIKNCESQYQVNKLNNKLSAKEAIKKLRTLKKDYQKAARQHSKDIKDEIVKKMIDCGGNSKVASSATVGSCTPAKLNMGSPGFCAKAAFSCSSNMKSCTDKAQKFVKETKDDRLKRTNNYNNNVESTRKQMVNMFDATLVKYMKEAESLRGMFGAGFVPPKDIEREISDDSKFNTKFNTAPDAIEIVNPKAYLAMIKANMANLRKQVETQQQSIMSDDGPLFKHIQETQKNYKEQVISKAGNLAKDCLAAYNSYKLMVKAQKEAYDKAQGEMGEKNGALCSTFTRIMSNNPNGACKVFEQVGKDSLAASGKGGGNVREINSMIGSMEERCAGAPQDGDDVGDICNNTNLPSSFIDYFNESYSKYVDPEKPNKKAVDYFSKACVVAQSGKGDVKTICAAGEEKFEDKVFESNIEDKTAALKDLNSQRNEDCTSEITKAVDKGNAGKFLWTATTKCKLNSKPDCSQVSKNIASIYKQAYKQGMVSSSSQTNSMPSTCPSGNNSGPFNTKGNLFQGQNPMAGQNGAGATQY